MRRIKETLISILVLIVLTSLVHANQTAPNSKLDPTLARDLFLLEQYQENPNSYNLERLRFFNLSAELEAPLAVFIHLDPDELPAVRSILSESAVKVYSHSWLPPVGAHQTGFLSARVTPSNLRQLLRRESVKRITAAYRELKPLNDITAFETRADVLWEYDSPLTGSGVRLLVIDSGFQLDHPDLPDPVATMDYSDFPEDTSANVTDLNSGHGTHVAGTAYGSGQLSAGRYRGMAPDAEPLYFKIGKDESSEATVEATVGAIRGAASWAEADILTISYGGYDGFNDGSSPEEQAMDWATSQGVSCFASAGNSGARNWHHRGQVGGRATTNPIQIISRMPGRGAQWMLGLSWYDGPDTATHRSLTALILDGNGAEILCDEPEWVSSPRGTEARIYLPHEELPVDSTSLFVTITNHSQEAQEFHLYLSEYWDLVFRQADRAYLISQPSSADSCISVGAYTQRAAFIDYRGNDRNFGGRDLQLAHFSARGPRLDGFPKPDLTAPGQQTISARNQDIIELRGGLDNRIIANDGDFGQPADYLALEGTSMSSPAAAGTAALVLQAWPDLTPAQLRERLCRNARRDEYTGQNRPNNEWGWGKIDAVMAVENASAPGIQAPIPQMLALTGVYPNPFNNTFKLEYSLHKSGFVEFSIFDVTGRQVWVEKQFVSQAGRQLWSPQQLRMALPGGTYLVNIRAGGEEISARVTMVK